MTNPTESGPEKAPADLGALAAQLKTVRADYVRSAKAEVAAFGAFERGWSAAVKRGAASPGDFAASYHDAVGRRPATRDYENVGVCASWQYDHCPAGCGLVGCKGAKAEDISAKYACDGCRCEGGSDSQKPAHEPQRPRGSTMTAKTQSLEDCCRKAIDLGVVKTPEEYAELVRIVASRWNIDWKGEGELRGLENAPPLFVTDADRDASEPEPEPTGTSFAAFGSFWLATTSTSVDEATYAIYAKTGDDPEGAPLVADMGKCGALHAMAVCKDLHIKSIEMETECGRRCSIEVCSHETAHVRVEGFAGYWIAEGLWRDGRFHVEDIVPSFGSIGFTADTRSQALEMAARHIAKSAVSQMEDSAGAHRTHGEIAPGAAKAIAKSKPDPNPPGAGE